MANEVGLTLNGTRRRCDTVVWDTHGQPAVIVEYKAPSITISQQVFDQIVRYNMVLKARLLMVSNGHAPFLLRDRLPFGAIPVSARNSGLREYLSRNRSEIIDGAHAPGTVARAEVVEQPRLKRVGHAPRVADRNLPALEQLETAACSQSEIAACIFQGRLTVMLDRSVAEQDREFRASVDKRSLSHPRCLRDWCT